MSIDAIIDATIGKEGAYSNHPSDRGGETMWGITAAVARANGYHEAMAQMPRETAKAIYRAQYFERPGFARVATLSPAVAEELFDTGVNMGPAVAGRFLQRALNVLTDAQLVPVGQVGIATVGALRAFIAKRGAEGERRLVALLNAFQGTRYAELTEGRPQNRAFMYGWLGRIS